MKIMAKDLIRTRHQITKFYALKSQLQGVSLRIQVNLAFFIFSRKTIYLIIQTYACKMKDIMYVDILVFSRR